MIWWRSRTVRERRMLAVMGATILLVLAWFALVRPMMDARAAAEARLLAATTELAQIRADAAALRQAAAPGAARVPLPLAGFVGTSAAEQGFANLAVSGDRQDAALMASPQVRPAPFLAWIGQLESRGIVVRSLTMRANADQTIAVQGELRAGAE